MSKVLKPLLSREAIAARVAELGAELTHAYAGKAPVFVVVLHGAFPFLADLVRAIPLQLEVDAIALTRFDSGGTVNLALSPSTSLEGRDVVIVEDIVDTGLTLRSLRAHLNAQNPASLVTVTLLDKVTRRLVDVPVEYSGFAIGDEFIVGYGMDWDGRYRNLPDVWHVLDLDALAKNAPALEAAMSDRVNT